jgi:1,4-dihydroxy-2-naphthoate octaprenyltransferase
MNNTDKKFNIFLVLLFEICALYLFLWSIVLTDSFLFLVGFIFVILQIYYTIKMR